MLHEGAEINGDHMCHLHGNLSKEGIIQSGVYVLQLALISSGCSRPLIDSPEPLTTFEMIDQADRSPWAPLLCGRR